MAPLPGLRLLLGYHNYYAIHGSPYTSAHALIENTLVQHKMAKNSSMGFVLPESMSTVASETGGGQGGSCPPTFQIGRAEPPHFRAFLTSHVMNKFINARKEAILTLTCSTETSSSSGV